MYSDNVDYVYQQHVRYTIHFKFILFKENGPTLIKSILKSKLVTIDFVHSKSQLWLAE